MAETKDLTNILELSRQTPEPTAGAEADANAFPESAVQAEPIVQFESLDALTASGPVGEVVQPEPTQPPVFSPAPSLTFGDESGANELPKFEATPEPAVIAEPASPVASPMDQVNAFAKSLPVGKPSGPAAFPFSLLIEGQLAEHEKEKLLTIVERENLGVRAVDLEPQLAADRVLVPRISEFAGVMIVQALRQTRAKMRLGPSDRIYASAETREDPGQPSSGSAETRVELTIDPVHPAENLPCTTEAEISGWQGMDAVDTVTASAAFHSPRVSPERGAEFQELIERLQREIKYKAYRKGAHGVAHFKFQLHGLEMPSSYRVVASGLAVRKK